MNNNIVKFDDVQKHIVQIKGKDVILDYAVAELYGVQTKEINQAVRNNPRKFPKGYVFQIDNKELADLRSKFLTTNHPKSRVKPKAVLKLRHTIKRKKEPLNTSQPLRSSTLNSLN